MFLYCKNCFSSHLESCFTYVCSGVCVILIEIMLFIHISYPLCAQSLQLCLTVCNPMDCSPQARLSMGFFRQDYWSRMQFPPAGDLPEPGTKIMSLESLMSPALVVGFFFYHWCHHSFCLIVFLDILDFLIFFFQHLVPFLHMSEWLEIYTCVCVCVCNGIVRARASLFPTTEASEARAQFRKWERRSQAQGLT